MARRNTSRQFCNHFTKGWSNTKAMATHARGNDQTFMSGYPINHRHHIWHGVYHASPAIHYLRNT